MNSRFVVDLVFYYESGVEYLRKRRISRSNAHDMIQTIAFWK